MTAVGLEVRIDAALRGVLPNSVNLIIAEGSADSDSGPEFLAEINGTPLRVVWIRHAWLGAINEMTARADHPDVLVSERVPPGSRGALIEAGIGWVETSGAAEISAGSLVVSRSGRRPRSDEEPSGGWTPSVVGVAEAVLAGIKPTVSATHDATGLSVGACTKALRTLTDHGLLAADAPRGRRSARRVVDADTLLDAYVSAAHDLRPPPSVTVGEVWQDPIAGLIEIGRRWDATGVAWAATGLVAAAMVAPLVTSVGTAETYVDAGTVSELELVAVEVGLRPIIGGRLRLTSFPTVTTRRMSVVADGLRVAPWPRLVADLRRSGVRGEEAAEHLKEVAAGG